MTTNLGSQKSTLQFSCGITLSNRQARCPALHRSARKTIQQFFMIHEIRKTHARHRFDGKDFLNAVFESAEAQGLAGFNVQYPDTTVSVHCLDGFCDCDPSFSRTICLIMLADSVLPTNAVPGNISFGMTPLPDFS